jgi:hypothetical protein
VIDDLETRVKKLRPVRELAQICEAASRAYEQAIEELKKVLDEHGQEK